MTNGDATRTDNGNTALGDVSQSKDETEDSTESNSTTVDSTSSASVNERPDVDLDLVFGLLKNQRRRDVLRYLEEPEQVRLGELAEHIAARECDKNAARITSQERKRVYVALYQCHLPKMADANVVTYNKPRGTIERGPNFDLFRYYLPDDEDITEPAGPGHGWVQALTHLLT